MATLGDLKTRIISETTRDDLADDLLAQFQTVIARSIDQYANERWWFNEVRQVVNATPGVQTIPWPTGARVVDGFYLELNGGVTRWTIRLISIDEMEALAQPAVTGQPTDYTLRNGLVYLWPIPNQPWQLAWDLISDVTPLLDYTDDTSSNFWTNQGQDLITAQSKIRLFRDFLSVDATDPRLGLAAAQEADAYSRLRAESTRRTATGRLQPSW
jgi:hypothetical protein